MRTINHHIAGESVEELAQRDLIREICYRTGFINRNVKEIFNVLEDIIYEYLDKAEENNPVAIRLFSGMMVGSYFVESHEAFNPQNREKIMTKPRKVPYSYYREQFHINLNNGREPNYIYEKKRKLHGKKKRPIGKKEPSKKNY